MIKIVAVGKVKEKAMQQLIQEYSKRLGAYCKFDIVEVNDGATKAENSEAQNEAIKKQEGERLLAKIKENEFVILVDLWGKTMTSEGLAELIQQKQTYGQSDITFVIGGSLGLSPEVVRRANVRWKLSNCTFPHQLVRLLVTEQIYRCYKIMNHEPYHK